MSSGLPKISRADFARCARTASVQAKSRPPGIGSARKALASSSDFRPKRFAITLRPRPTCCGNTNHIQWLRFWPARNSSNTVEITAFCASMKCKNANRLPHFFSSIDSGSTRRNAPREMSFVASSHLNCIRQKFLWRCAVNLDMIHCERKYSFKTIKSSSCKCDWSSRNFVEEDDLKGNFEILERMFLADLKYPKSLAFEKNLMSRKFRRRISTHRHLALLSHSKLTSTESQN